MPQTGFKEFQRLHEEDTPLLLPNAWDAASATLFQQAGACAVGTSSAALAWSLGFADGGSLPKQELLASLQRIRRVLRVPLSVDLENGYSSNPDEVAQLVAQVARLGVAGINLEDGADDPPLLAEKIVACRKLLAGLPLFINVRTDVYFRGMAVGEAARQMAIDRLRRYVDAGADGCFVPGIRVVQDVAAVAGAIPRPLNLMLMPGMPSIRELTTAGARRISAGPAFFQSAYAVATAQAEAFLKGHEASTLISDPLPYDWMNALFSVS